MTLTSSCRSIRLAGAVSTTPCAIPHRNRSFSLKSSRWGKLVERIGNCSSMTWELKPTSPALLKRYGFLYDSSLMGDDEPYLIDAGDNDEKLLEIPIQWMNDDWAYFGFSSIPALGNGIASPQAVFEVWSEEFAGYYDFGGCYVLTMHPFVIGRPSRIRLLERLIEFIKTFDGVWFATLEQIANHALATGQVRYRPHADLGEG